MNLNLVSDQKNTVKCSDELMFCRLRTILIKSALNGSVKSSNGTIQHKKTYLSLIYMFWVF